MEENESGRDWAYYPGFGPVGSESDPAVGNRYQVPGRELDGASELEHRCCRCPDPNIGRWVAENALGFEAADSNRYRHVCDSSSNAVDPGGQDESGQG